MPEIYDNITQKLDQALRETLSESIRADFCVGYFNLRGWGIVSDSIDALEGAEIQEKSGRHHRVCRLIVGMHQSPLDLLRDHYFRNPEYLMDGEDAVRLKMKLAEEFRQQLILGIPTGEDELALRNLSRQLKAGRIAVKLHLEFPMHAKLYLAFDDSKRAPIIGFLGSSNLTMAGLSKQGELNIDVKDQDAARKLESWFNERWDSRLCLDITKELWTIIDESWAGEKLVSPYHVYLKIAYHLSQEARAGLAEVEIPKLFKDILFEYQQEAVKIAAKKLEKRGGVMIGDVVGLGKTITACALAKLYEENKYYSSAVIICPPNLKAMWEGCIKQYDLKAWVKTFGEIQREPEARPAKLVIIDESHNLRNKQGARYQAVREYIRRHEPHVVLLSATPYNKSYLDLSNQLQLFLAEDSDIGITPDRYLEFIGGKAEFEATHTASIRSIKAFEHSEFAQDWQELMRLYMVRRTRTFIKNNYAEPKHDPSARKYLTLKNGQKLYFPDRVPKRVEYHFDANDPDDQYARLYSQQVVDTINGLGLPRYGLGNFLAERQMPTATKGEEAIITNLGRAGKRLMGFCRTNLFKRLESSGYSFLLSLSRMVLRNYVFVYAIQNKLPLPLAGTITHDLEGYLDDQDFDVENQENAGQEKQHHNRRIVLNFSRDAQWYADQAQKVYALFSSGKHQNQFDWISSDRFTSKLEESLVSDSLRILEILALSKDWDPKSDRQLKALYHLLSEKHKNEKVLVFTQFADTAEYLYVQLAKLGVTQLECVTGDSDDPTAIAHRFSPRSNGHTGKSGGNHELRVLITTDVLSEGQNLQDCHLVVNFDLPWALIRLIQRAGRVDRIGQKSEQIICYSFLPEDGLEQIIRLRQRLGNRIQQNAEVVGSDETFFDGDPVNVADLYNEKSGLLDDEEDDLEVDLSSYAFQIWKNAIETDPSLIKKITDMSPVSYASKANSHSSAKQGVIVYVRTAEENDVLAWVNDVGNIITQSQFAILKAAECDPGTQALERMGKHHDLVTRGLALIREEEVRLGGGLGKKSGIKYRTFDRLKQYATRYESTLLITDGLKRAIDDIYHYPLTKYAQDLLNRKLRAGANEHELASMVVSLREEGRLSIIHDDEHERTVPQIICSMGLINT